MADNGLRAALDRANERGRRYAAHEAALQRGQSVAKGTYVCPPPGCALDPKPPPPKEA